MFGLSPLLGVTLGSPGTEPANDVHSNFMLSVMKSCGLRGITKALTYTYDALHLCDGGNDSLERKNMGKLYSPQDRPTGGDCIALLVWMPCWAVADECMLWAHFMPIPRRICT